jgi:hypothetical protein
MRDAGRGEAAAWLLKLGDAIATLDGNCGFSLQVDFAR